MTITAAYAALVIVLILLNIAQFFFWSRQVQRLVDKLMSRNYAEYHQLQNPPEKMQPSGITIPLADVRQDLGALEGFGVG